MDFNKRQLYTITQEYYKAWGNKDLGKLKSMFSENIVLIDPVIKKARGLESVLEINKNIFNSCAILEILELRILVDHFSNTTIGEAKFKCGENKIEVVDIFTFDTKMKIDSITAYLDT